MTSIFDHSVVRSRPRLRARHASCVLVPLFVGLACASSSVWVNESGALEVCLGLLTESSRAVCEADARGLGYVTLPQTKLGVSLRVGSNTVATVDEGSPAARAGIQVGDRLERLAGRRIRGFGDLVEALEAHAPGDAVAIDLKRRGALRGVQATLAAR